MNKQTIQAADFVKKSYEKPQVKVYQVKPTSIICTSDTQVQTNNLNYDSGEYEF